MSGERSSHATNWTGEVGPLPVAALPPLGQPVEPSAPTDEQFFDRYVGEWMVHDVQTAIDGNANYLAALGLLCYTEFLGGFVTGNGAVGGQSARNFKAFLPYLGAEYVAFDREHNTYKLFRCGIAHEYFAKEPAWVFMRSADPSGCGFRMRGDEYEFVVVSYFRDFQAGAGRLRERLFEVRDPELLDRFRKVRGRRWV